jgi:hypothetical protein
MPQFEGKISVGNIITLITLLISAASMWGAINARIDSIDRNGTVAMQQFRQEMIDLKIEIVQLKTILQEERRRDNAYSR